MGSLVILMFIFMPQLMCLLYLMHQRDKSLSSQGNYPWIVTRMLKLQTKERSEKSGRHCECLILCPFRWCQTCFRCDQSNWTWTSRMCLWASLAVSKFQFPFYSVYSVNQCGSEANSHVWNILEVPHHAFTLHLSCINITSESAAPSLSNIIK